MAMHRSVGEGGFRDPPRFQNARGARGFSPSCEGSGSGEEAADADPPATGTLPGDPPPPADAHTADDLTGAVLAGAATVPTLATSSASSSDADSTLAPRLQLPLGMRVAWRRDMLTGPPKPLEAAVRIEQALLSVVQQGARAAELEAQRIERIQEVLEELYATQNFIAQEIEESNRAHHKYIDASFKELKEVCAHEDCLVGAARALYVKPSQITLESHRAAEREKQALAEAHKPQPKMDGAKDTTSKTYWVYLKPTALRRQMALDNVEAVQHMAESATHVRHHMKRQVALLQARKALWVAVSRDSQYVRDYLLELLERKVADLNRHAAAALVESDQALAAACVGSFAVAAAASRRRDELAAQTEALCELHQGHAETIAAIVAKQGETALADETYLEFVGEETRTIVENHRAKVAALVSDVERALKARPGLLQAATDEAKRTIQDKLMAK